MKMWVIYAQNSYEISGKVFCPFFLTELLVLLFLNMGGYYCNAIIEKCKDRNKDSLLTFVD